MVRRVVIFLALGSLAFAADLPWRDQALLNLASTPQAKLRPVPVRAVRFRPGFWKSRQDVTIEKSIPSLLDQLEQHGTLNNFRRLADPSAGIPRRGPLYTDSDLYKWLEAAAWSLAVRPDPSLEATIDKVVDTIVSAQEPSGYLNTWFAGEREKLRFQQMTSGHELYCLGHMLQGAIAYYRVTGKRKLLDAGIRFADYLLAGFGPAPKRPLLTGHPELELALAELYRTTGNRAYLDLAGYLLSGVERERLKLAPRDLSYLFSGSPFTERTHFEGHAVRALYAATGAADYWLETGDPAYRKTLDALWGDLAGGKVFVTGGVGSRASGEAFGESYELPNRQAYTESCAAIAGALFNQRMLAASGDARYMDLIERALYNGIASGMSLDGTTYCYRNPLAATAADRIRNPWYDTCCCPPNLQRTLAALGAWFFSTSDDGLWVHLYDNADLDWRLADGSPLKASLSTGMPWAGNAELSLRPAAPAKFTLHLRIPEWSQSTKLSVNGKPVAAVARPGTYLEIARTWNPGDSVTLAFDMATRLVRSNPRVPENFGKAAVQRGPLVYILEQTDNPGVNVFEAALSLAPFVPERREALLGGVTVLKHQGLTFARPLSEEPLYGLAMAKPTRQAPLTLVPYYTFHNRGPADFTLWMPAP
jgi:hypothetical protein